MIASTHTPATDVQKAVVLARLDVQAAKENVQRIIRTDYFALALTRIIDGLTASQARPRSVCPRCGESDPENLVLGVDLFEEHVLCTLCIRKRWLR